MPVHKIGICPTIPGGLPFGTRHIVVLTEAKSWIYVHIINGDVRVPGLTNLGNDFDLKFPSFRDIQTGFSSNPVHALVASFVKNSCCRFSIFL